MIRLAIVVPCYNEQEVLPDTNKQLTGLIKELKAAKQITEDSFILYVDDGSRDDTWKIIDEFAKEESCVQGLKLAGNVGHQNALLAGLMTVKDEVDAAISIDADLQDAVSAAEDADAMWEYITGNVADADHVLLAGDSAGGNMALCMTQRLISEGKPAPRELLLFSPWTDMTGTSASYAANKDIDPVLNKEFVMNSAKAYIGDRDHADPAFSPLFGSFENFPPVFIMAGRNGILLDDSIRLKAKIDEAGGKAELDIEEKGWHVYLHMPGSMTRKALKRLAAHVSHEIYGKR